MYGFCLYLIMSVDLKKLTIPWGPAAVTSSQAGNPRPLKWSHFSFPCTETASAGEGSSLPRKQMGTESSLSFSRNLSVMPLSVTD